MNFVETMKQTAKELQRRLVLPEGTEPRMVRAARQLIDESLAAEVVLLGAEDAVSKIAKDEGVDLAGVTVTGPVRVGPTAGVRRRVPGTPQKEGYDC